MKQCTRSMPFIFLICIVVTIALMLSACGKVPKTEDKNGKDDSEADATIFAEPAEENWFQNSFAKEDEQRNAEEQNENSDSELGGQMFDEPAEDSELEDYYIYEEDGEWTETDDFWEEEEWVTEEQNETGAPPPGDYDEIIESYEEDGYYVVYKDLSTFDTVDFQVGIVRADGSWALEYGRLPIEYISNWDLYIAHPNQQRLMPASRLEYWGNGVFAYYTHEELAYPELSSAWDYRRSDFCYDYHFVSCETNTEFDINNLIKQNYLVIDGTAYLDYGGWYGGHDRDEDVFGSEYNYIICTDGVYVVTLKDGVVGEFDEPGKSVQVIGPYADGGFVYYTTELRFFDCNTLTSTSICKDSDRLNPLDVKWYAFHDGQLDIKVFGADGKTYYAIVDKRGNYNEEPHIAQ